ncbi:MAG: dUTP diphosphatase [Clostridia bacterium]|nr:dUTP diphosphatase [Clostridia bacterium]
MQEIELKIMPVPHEGVGTTLPEKATGGSAGLDLRAAVAQSVTLAPRGAARLPTGIAVGLPSGYVGLVFARSGLAIRHGIALSNGVGVIDSDYTGEIIVGLCNLSDEPYIIEPCERIAQLLVMPVASVRPVTVRVLDQTERAQGGFGSTGKF